MVLSEKPERSLQTPFAAAEKRESGSSVVAQPAREELNLPGDAERVVSMVSGRNGRQTKTKTFSRKQLFGMALPLVYCLAGTAAAAQSAGTWNKRGQNAEDREDYDAAFEAFRQAHLKKP